MDGLEPGFARVTIVTEQDGLAPTIYSFAKVDRIEFEMHPVDNWLGVGAGHDFQFAGRSYPDDENLGVVLPTLLYLTDAERHHLAYSACAAAYQETDPRYWNKDPEERVRRRDRWCDIAEQLGWTGSLPHGVHRTL